MSERGRIAVEPDRRVSLLPAACIALRIDAPSCTACLDACPVDCIEIAAGSFRVSEHCIGCGHCAAACPTGALAVKGFEDLPAASNGDAVHVECVKVPEAATREHSLRVPCLGGLSVARWLRVVEKAGDRPVVAVDRGWCGRCEVAARKGGAHPAAAALDRAALLADSHSLRLKFEPLPPNLMPARIPGGGAEAPSRRGFFLRIGNEARRAVGLDDNDATIPAPRALRDRPMPLPERERLVATLERLVDKGQPLPAAAFHRIEIGAACTNHGVCAGVCPTLALVRYEEADRAGVSFDAARCIGCARCVAACPEQALTLQLADSTPDLSQPARVSNHQRHQCRDCLQPYFGATDDGRCPGCRRKRAMGASLFGRP